MPKDVADRLMEDVFKAVQAGQPAAPNVVKATARLADRNKRNLAIMVAAGVATAFVAAATGGVALVAVAAYAGAKGGSYVAKRSWRSIKSRWYMSPVNSLVETIREKNDESLSVERVDGDLVARDVLVATKGSGLMAYFEADTLLNKIRNQIQHSQLSVVMNDFIEFENAKEEFDKGWVAPSTNGVRSCGEAIKLLELLGKMSRQYSRIAIDFELLCELATFMVLHKSKMDEDFRKNIDPVMEHLSGCYGRSPKEAKYENPLVDLLNEAANSRDVLRHWNQFGGKDHRGWVGAVLGVEGKTNILAKYAEKAAGPYSRDSRDVKDQGLGLLASSGIGGGSAGGKLLANEGNLYQFDPRAVAGGFAVGAGEAVLTAGANAANTAWNRYMLKRNQKLGFSGWNDLSHVDLVKLYRGEAKKEIESMVDKFSHLLIAHAEWLKDAQGVRVYSKGFDTLLIPATKLLRRQKLYWQLFHAETGLFANFAQFYEKVAYPVILAEASYLRETDDTSTVHWKVEGALRAWLSNHESHDVCEGPCYMTTLQFAAQRGWAVKNLHQGEEPIRPIGANLVPARL